jgi:pimeloyl-ACP methyl ester carboxylesterase
MATFVLVHGAWGGAHGFGRVRRLLQSAGHEVFTPSLTGIGERAHLASPQVCLTTHVADVVNAVLYEDLRDIVLLGFSYGGAVVTGSLEHVGDRVSHLVYLDAFVPGDGQSVDGTSGGRAAAIGPAASWQVPPRERDFDDPAEAAWSAARRTPHPAPSRMLQRANPARPPLGGIPVHPHLYQGIRRTAHRAAGAVLDRRGPGQELPCLALPGNSLHPHDPEQPPARPGTPADGAHLIQFVTVLRPRT